MATERSLPGAGGEELATVLDGLGGAPARPGVVHVIGVGRRDVGQGPTDPATLTLRAAVLIATADHVIIAPEAAADAARLARPGASVAEEALHGLAGVLPEGSVAVLVPDAGRPPGIVLAEQVRATGREVEVVANVGPLRAVLAAAGIVAPSDRLPPGGGPRLAVEVDRIGPQERQALASRGADPETPVLVIEAAGTPAATITAATVGTLPDAPRAPAVLVVGTHHHLPWREALPLAGVSVLVPRATGQASRLSMRIRSLGGEAVEAPTITIEPGDEDALRAALRDLADGAFTAVCLTSPNGVDAVAEALDAAGLDARAFAEVRTLACVGPGTAGRLWQRLHVRADLLPPASTTAALAEAFPAGDGRVLLPRADIATNTLAAGLVDKGYEPVEVAAYVTGTPEALPADVLRRLERGDIDLVAFASSSTARNFAALVGDRPWRADVVSIGPVTSATCAEVDIPVAVEADPHDLDGLVAALCEAAARR